MRVPLSAAFILASLASCGAPPPPALPTGTKADRIVVVKHQGWLTAYADDEELVTYFNIGLGNAPAGRKRYEGDGMVPEGDYRIARDAPDSRRPCSLRISFPNAVDRAYAAARGRSPGGHVEIRGSIPLPRNTRDDALYDGGIELSDPEMRQLCDIVPNGIPITIRA